MLADEPQRTYAEGAGEVMVEFCTEGAVLSQIAVMARLPTLPARSVAETVEEFVPSEQTAARYQAAFPEANDETATDDPAQYPERSAETPVEYSVQR